LLCCQLMRVFAPEVRGRYAVLFVRSSGSTYLCSLLNDQPGVLCHDEYVGDSLASIQSVSGLPLRLIEKALANSGFNQSEVTKWKRERRSQASLVVGFKQKVDVIWPSIHRLCSRTQTRLVFLFRTNVASHVVSIIRKDASIRELQSSGKVIKFEKNYNNQSRTIGAKRWRQTGSHAQTNRGIVQLGPIDISINVFIRVYDSVRRSNDLLEYYYSIAPASCRLRIAFEDLQSDSKSVLQNVVNHINGTASNVKWPVPPRIRKGSPRTLSESVANWAQLSTEIRQYLPRLPLDE